MIKIPVIIDEHGCAISSTSIPENAVMAVMNNEFVIVYEEGDDLPTSNT